MKKSNPKTLAKFAIALLLLLCLLDMPYGYYQFMRIAVCGLFIYLTFYLYEEKQILPAIACIAPIIIFQPISKLAFHKQEWQTIDLWLAIALIIWGCLDLFKRVVKRAT